MGLGDPIDPVVVLLGERPGAHRRGDDLLEASQLLGAFGQVGSCAIEGFRRARADAGDARIGKLAFRSQSLREDGQDLCWIVAPRRRFEVEVLLSDIAVHVEERFELTVARNGANT